MSTIQGMNPYLPSWEYVPDGEPHVSIPDGDHKLFLEYHAPVPADPDHASLQLKSIEFIV